MENEDSFIHSFSDFNGVYGFHQMRDDRAKAICAINGTSQSIYGIQQSYRSLFFKIAER